MMNAQTILTIVIQQLLILIFGVTMKQITVIVMPLAQTLMVPSHVLVILDTVEIEFPVSMMMNTL